MLFVLYTNYNCSFYGRSGQRPHQLCFVTAMWSASADSTIATSRGETATLHIDKSQTVGAHACLEHTISTVLGHDLHFGLDTV